MKFTAAVLFLAFHYEGGKLGGGSILPSAHAFVLPRSAAVATTQLEMSGGGGEALKRGVKFLLVPNAKQPPPSAPRIPYDQIPDTTTTTTVVTPPSAVQTVNTNVPPPAVTTAPPPAVVEQVAATPPPPPVVVTTTPPPPAAAEEVVTRTAITSPMDAFANLKPLPGMQVDWTETVEQSYRPHTAASSGAVGSRIVSATSTTTTTTPAKWETFDWATWWHEKTTASTSGGPVNVGPPKLMQDVTGDGFDFQSNWQNFQQAAQGWATSWALFKTSLADVSALTTSGVSYSQQDFERALNLKETSGWYLALMGSLGVAWWNVATSSSSESSSSLSSSSMPSHQAVPRGGMAAVGDNIEQMEVEIAQREALVAEQVTQLTQATKAVTQQLAELQSAKAKRDYDVARMKSDLREMRNQLDLTQRSENDLRLSLERTQDQFQSETQALRQQLEERTQAEAAVKKELENTKAKLEKEMATIAAAKDQAETQVAEALKQVKALEKEKKAKEQEIATLQAQVQSLQEQLEQVAASPKKAAATKTATAATTDSDKATATKGAKSEPAPEAPPTVAKKETSSSSTKKDATVAAAATSNKKAASKSTKKSKKASSKKKQSAATKKAQPAKEAAVEKEKSILESLSNAFFANITEPVASTVEPQRSAVPSPPKSPKSTKKASPKASTSKKKAAAPKAKATVDWKALSPSSLKRKTVKDLQAYLEEQVPVSDHGQRI